MTSGTGDGAAGAAGATANGATATGAGEGSTRERILDVALDLFVERGYDKTSLREIADRMGFTKAALYYHFENKAALLMALHMRLHELGAAALDGLGDGPVGMATWARFLDETIDTLQDNRKLFELHQRNQSALEELHHSAGHDQRHAELEERARAVLSNPELPARQRVRMAAAFVSAFFVAMAGERLTGLRPDEAATELRAVVRDLLGT